MKKENSMENGKNLETGNEWENTGWVKIHRRLLDNPALMENHKKLALWICLLLLATHQERKGLFKGKNITLEPGQFITGLKFLSKLTKISRSTIDRYMKWLKTEHQVEQEITAVNRLVTITNWKLYQVDETGGGKRVGNEWKTGGKRVENGWKTGGHIQECLRTNKNVKNDKEANFLLNSSIKEESREDPTENKEVLARLEECLNADLNEDLNKNGEMITAPVKIDNNDPEVIKRQKASGWYGWKKEYDKNNK